MKSLTISFNSMQKAEFPQFAKDMLQIIEKHNSEELKLQVVYNLLADTMPALAAMKVRQGKHELTVPLQALHADRCKNANLLVSYLNVYLRDSNHIANAKKVEACIRHHLAHINRWGAVKASEHFDMFFASVEASSDVKAALETLGLNTYVENAKAAHTQYRMLNKQRRSELNKSADKLTAQARALVSKNVKDALQIIESASLMHPDIDYRQLKAELNALIAQYKAKLKARSTRKTNKLLNATTAASSTKTVAAAV